MGRIKPIIGLCGGIGAGKSVVAHEFERLGGLLIDSDELNPEVLRRPEVARPLRDWWGDAAVGADGRVNRSGVAEVVFGDPAQKQRLESLVHPLIAALREDIITTGIGDPRVTAIILDSPLLLESNLDRMCHAVVFVEAGESQRLRRLHETRGWDMEELRRRERWQLPLPEKRARSRFAISNEGTIGQLRSQVKGVFEQVLAEYSSDQ